MKFSVVTHGFGELESALEDVKVKVDPAVGKALRAAAKPVQQTAQQMAVDNIRNIGVPWDQMKIGRKRLGVYVAEKQKKHGGAGGRPNLSQLLMSRALVPALNAHRAEVTASVRAVIDMLCRRV